MHPSDFVLRIATVHPAIASAFVRAWEAVDQREQAAPHWLLARLRDLADAGPVSLNVGDSSHIVAPGHFWVSRCVRRHGEYEPAVVAVARALLKPGMCAIDVGANVGFFSVLFAELVGQSGRILAFEPNGGLYERLVSNLRMNGFSHVEPIRTAVSNAPGRLPLYRGEFDVTHSLRPSRMTTAQTDIVDVVTLDSVAREHGISRVDFVKIDVEGGELQVLQGASELLTRDRPCLIAEVSEWSSGFGYSPSDLTTFLETLGYQLLAIDRERPLEWSGSLSGDDHCNLLAIPSHMSAAIPGLLDALQRISRTTAARGAGD